MDKTQANECIGVSRGGRSTKIHAVVDALGNPIEIMLMAGNVHDVTVAEELLSRIRLKGSTVLADKAYGKWALREFIANHDADFCIPPKDNEADPWFVDWWLYKRSFVVSLPAMINSLPVSFPSSIWLVSVSFLHNPCRYAFGNTL